MRVHVLRLLLLRVRVWVLVLLLALLGGPLVAVRQLGQVLLGTRLHLTVHKVVILMVDIHADTHTPLSDIFQLSERYMLKATHVSTGTQHPYKQSADCRGNALV
jgi:hypothetical protein